MKLMHKIAIIAMGIVVATGLASCGRNNSQGSNSAKTTQTTNQELSCSKALSQVQNEYKGIAKVTYKPKDKSLIFLITNGDEAEKIQHSANEEAKWFSQVTRKPNTQAQIKLTKKAQEQQNKLLQKQSKKQRKNKKNQKNKKKNMKNNKNKKLNKNNQNNQKQIKNVKIKLPSNATSQNNAKKSNKKSNKIVKK